MVEPKTIEQRLRLAVIVADYGGSAHVGTPVEFTVRTFDLPPEVESYIRKKRHEYSSVTLGLEDHTP
jgi:hypothetical protein